MSDEEKTVGIRKLTAILSADVFGYSRLMSTDEASTFKRLTDCREIIFRLIREHHGRVANTAGDAVLAEFASVRDAAAGAIEIQKALAELNSGVSADQKMHFRIGINLGDVYEQQGDLFGDGVNLAARIQSLADPGGILLSASVYEQLEHKSDVPVEFAGEQKVKNMEKPVKVYRVVMKNAPASVIAAPALPQEITESAPPSIVVGVLPFENLSEDPEQAYFCDGLVEDLTTALAAIPEMKTIARNTMFGFKGKSPDVRQLARDIGATHVVEGSVRKSGSRIRINAQLLETKEGSHLWARRYDKEIADLFDIQDDIVRSIATEMDVHLIRGEQARFWRATTRNAEAYDLLMQALSSAAIFAPQSFHRALASLERALDLDPDFLQALCFKSLYLRQQARNGMCSDPDEGMRQSRLACEKALRLDSRYPSAHANLAALLQIDGKLEESKKEWELSMSLNPNISGILSGWGWYCLLTRDYQKALSAVRRANELAPFPQTLNIALEALALQFLGRPEESLVIVSRALRRQQGDLFLWVTYAGLTGPLGLVEESKKAVLKILEIQPNFSAERFATSNAMFDHETAESYARVLHQLGLP
ncbi:MAG: adenylate/guanylate cyclase domain-containing protein [Spirochaetia bacterium]|jgi:adenylate cyclase